MSSGSRVEGVRERAVALLRLGGLALAFFQIAFELLDQVQNRWRFAVVIDCRHYFPRLVFAVAPHKTPFLSYIHSTLQRRKAIIFGPSNDVAIENKAVACQLELRICYFPGCHVGFRGALETNRS